MMTLFSTLSWDNAKSTLELGKLSTTKTFTWSWSKCGGLIHLETLTVTMSEGIIILKHRIHRVQLLAICNVLYFITLIFGVYGILILSLVRGFMSTLVSSVLFSISLMMGG